MSDSVLERISSRKPEPASPGEVDVVDDLGAFGWLRGIRDRAEMLELRHRNGTITAHGYAWLKTAYLDPSGEIVLDFSGAVVTIVGRNLNREASAGKRLYEGILRRKVPWLVVASNSAALTAADDAVIIEDVDSK